MATAGLAHSVAFCGGVPPPNATGHHNKRARGGGCHRFSIQEVGRCGWGRCAIGPRPRHSPIGRPQRNGTPTHTRPVCRVPFQWRFECRPLGGRWGCTPRKPEGVAGVLVFKKLGCPLNPPPSPRPMNAFVQQTLLFGP